MQVLHWKLPNDFTTLDLQKTKHFEKLPETLGIDKQYQSDHPQDTFNLDCCAKKLPKTIHKTLDRKPFFVYCPEFLYNILSKIVWQTHSHF